MFASLKHLFGHITVDVDDKRGVVRVEGVPAHVISNDIRRLWGTSKVDNNLFLEVESSAFSFYEFFALEVDYALGRLIEERKVRCNRRTLTKIREALKASTWIGNLDKTFPSRLNKDALHRFKLTPKEFQAPFFEFFDQMPQKYDLSGGCLAGAAGSGKTFIGLAAQEMAEVKHVFVC